MSTIGLAAVLAAPLARAVDKDLSFHVGDTWSDNVTYSADDPVADHITGVATKIGLATSGPVLEATARADLTYLHYIDDTFDDQFQRGFIGDARLNFFDGRFSWIATDNYGPVLEDPLSTDRPDNWTYDNYFTTGPDVVFGPLSGTHVLAGARYARVDYETATEPGNEQYSANLGLVFPSSARTETSLNVNGRRVKQQEVESNDVLVPAFDYDLGEAYAHYSNDGSRNSMSIDAGVSALRTDDSSEQDGTSTAPLLRLGLGRKITPRLTLMLYGGTQYQENLGRFQRLQNTPQPGGQNPGQVRDDVITTSSPLKDTYGTLMLSYDGARTAADFSVSHNRVDVEGNEEAASSLAADQQYTTANFALQRQVTPTLTLELAGNYQDRDYDSLGRRDKDVVGQLSSVWRLQRELELTLIYQYRERDSNIPNAQYQVNSIQLELVYRPASEIAARARENRWRVAK
ncbi:MAG TPA: outer membrane beta-barrel protein [Steroidobacteraceae bacterium]|nr:outer membrane beta-barrel protein [Steroidobacteraceae bacterium]